MTNIKQSYSNTTISTPVKENLSNTNPLSARFHFEWWLCFSIISVLAFVTRFYKIAEPNHVWYDKGHDFL